MLFRNRCKLLPHIREEITYLTTSSKEFQGWEITKFNIPNAWYNSMGDDVTVGVIDTGVDLSHEDLVDNLLKGKNFVNKHQDPIDGNGHGTHVSGTIAAVKNGTGMVGVAPKTKIIPVKSLDDDGSGTINHIIDGVEWCADNGCDFITMSLGSPYPHARLEKAIEYANKKGCIVFCAAGNSGKKVDIMYPAKYENTISIGAIDKNLTRTSFTCSGDSLDFLAPGHDILSCVPGNKYSLMSGTSMSNPFAVGCASLLLSYNKKSKKYSLNTLDDYIDIFKKYAINLIDPEYSGIKKYQGYGIIQPVI